MFGKIFAQTFHGSMYGAGADKFALWAYVISHAKHNGTVELNPKELAVTIGMKPEAVAEALAYLCAEDLDSRTKTDGGRRLKFDGGYTYTVVNIGKYRGIRNEDERREYMRLKKQESRERLKKPGNGAPADPDAEGAEHEPEPAVDELGFPRAKR